MDNIKKFEDFLDRMQGLLDNAKKQGHIIVRVDDIENIFPELKESEDEDEKIRKWCVNLIKTTCDYDSPTSRKEVDDALAWLEKQGKQSFAIRWHDVSLIPREMEELLVEWDSNDATWHDVAFYHADSKTFWNGERQVENVTRWAYIDDLFERRGENTLIEEIKRRKELLISEKEKETSLNTKLSLGGRIAMLEELLVFANEKQCEQKPTDEEMKELLRTEYEKGRADAIAETQVAWSEEDKDMINHIIFALPKMANGCIEMLPSVAEEYAERLKDLKQRITNKQ